MKRIRILKTLIYEHVLVLLILGCLMQSCDHIRSKKIVKPLSDEEKKNLSELPLNGIQPTDIDSLKLAEGLSQNILIQWNQRITKTLFFGYNNGFLCFIPTDPSNPNDGLLWVNHESVNPIFVSGYDKKNGKKTKQEVDKEMEAVGGSIVRIKKQQNKWTIIPNDPLNRRINAQTEITFKSSRSIMGTYTAKGTHSNTSGSLTPWGTIMITEQDYDDYFGQIIYGVNGNKVYIKGLNGWENIYQYPPEHYGWMVEVEPRNGKIQKHVSLGRFKHQSIAFVPLKDGRVVVYMTEEDNEEYLYKFISYKPNDLSKGILLVADIKNDKWLPLDYNTQHVLQKHFKSQTEILIRTKEAAKKLGANTRGKATHITVNPSNGDILIAMEQDLSKGQIYGSIIKIVEEDNDYESFSFTTETIQMAHSDRKFTHPNNLTFDLSGNLWFTSDMPAELMNKQDNPYGQFKNNALFVLLNHGSKAKQLLQIASAPRDATFSGISFSPDNKTLFLSVKNPGKQSKSLTQLTSSWPNGVPLIPNPSIVTIEGKLLDKITRLKELYNCHCMIYKLSSIKNYFEATVDITGSKSISNRLLVLEKVIDGTINIQNLSDADDTVFLKQCLESKGNLHNVGLAGTSMRFMVSYLSILSGQTNTLTGLPPLNKRPIKILVEGLKKLGADITYLEQEGSPPLRIKGGNLNNNFLEIDANVSSQYITSLMLIAPKLQQGLTIQLSSEPTSKPYLKMTMQLLAQIGIEGSWTENRITISPQKEKVDKTIYVEPDWSAASYYYSLVALAEQAKITLNGFNTESLQGDRKVVEIYEKLGVTTEFTPQGIVLSKQAQASSTQKLELNLVETPDLAQTIAVTCIGLGINCHLTGLHTLKVKETDRLIALKTELEKLGGTVTVTDNSLMLTSPNTLNKNVTIATYHDHRMAMAFAPLVAKTDLSIADPKVASKSYPSYWKDLEKTGITIECT